MSKEQTAGEAVSKWAAIFGGAATALTLEQLLGLAIGLCGVAASWWLAIKRNERDKKMLAMMEEEHVMRMSQGATLAPTKLGGD